MKHLRRILPLLLTALLMLALLPAAAMADPPPYDDFGLYHEWLISDQRGPTCEDYGYTTWTCSVCGQTWTEYSGAPLGHDWDEGELVKDPEGFTAGEILYTCKNDPSHTREEPINPVPALIAGLEGHLPPPVLMSNLPRITLQPVGGKISRGGSDGHTMTVAAEGGLPPYTYEWHYVDNGGSISLSENAVNDTLKATGLLTGGAAASAQSDWYAAMAEVWADMPQADWVAEAAMDAFDAKFGPSILGARSSGKLGGGEPSYTAYAGNCSYYCVVIDNADQRAVSDTVRVDYGLAVRTQPENTNLPLGGYAELVCEACDGTGNYTYTWMNADGGTAEGTSTEPGHFRVEKTGDYFCVISDGEEEIASDTASVYEAETLVELAWSKDVLKWPEESVELYAAFEGGTPPYTAEWRSNGTTVSTVQSEEPYFTITVDDFEPYHCYVEDSMGQKAHVFVHAVERHLNITKQPVGGYLPKDGYLELSIEVEGGEGYLHYLLIQDDTVREEDSEGKFKVYEPGVYCIGVYDRKAHWAKSLPVTVEDSYFRITEQTDGGVLTRYGDSIPLYVKVDGGTPPYDYHWYVVIDENFIYEGGPYDLSSRGPGVTATARGTYFCIVEDKEHNSIMSRGMTVTYNGEAPFIEYQTGNIYLDNGEGGESHALICDAIPGNGGDAARLRYEWFYSAPGGSDWSKCGEGQIIGVSNNQSFANGPGRYYCLVTDESNGTSTKSAIITVNVKLEITDVTRLGSGYEFGILCSYEGGTPPYSARVYTDWETNPEDSNYTERILFTSRDQITEMSVIIDGLRAMHDYACYIRTDNNGKVLKYQRQFSVYYLEIKDALGQVVTYNGIRYNN